jgi:23S rRNA G2069 N7-methylase RlmK/C1962 C5-methylase RlmI
VLKKGEEERIVAGHPWIFDNEIERIEGHPETGEGIPCSVPTGASSVRAFSVRSRRYASDIQPRGREA